MDIVTINAYNRVIEDLTHDLGLEPELKAQMLSALAHRVWELENWEHFFEVEGEK